MTRFHNLFLLQLTMYRFKSMESGTPQPILVTISIYFRQSSEQRHLYRVHVELVFLRKENLMMKLFFYFSLAVPSGFTLVSVYPVRISD